MAKRPFRRTDRLSSQIKQILAISLQRDSREEALRSVVITDVEVTRDLSLARVYYYLIDGDQEAATSAFGRANGYLRTVVGRGINARITPELRFMHDDALTRGRRIDDILSTLDIPEDHREEE